MRFDRRFFVVLSASLVWAMVVSAVFYRMAAGSGGHRTEARKPVVVATKPLAIGETVTREEIQLRDVPESFFPPGGISRLEDVVDRPVTSPIGPEEPVVEARLAAKGSGMGLAPLIPSGMRALAVRVNDVVGVAGFILPGMRVDVLVTGRPVNGTETMTRTVLQNIAVLSAGQTIQTDGKSQSIQVPVVTLLVNPHEAEALTLANSEGKVQLVLRNSADGQLQTTSGSGTRELFGGAGVSETGPPAPPREAPRRLLPDFVVRKPLPSAVTAVAETPLRPANPEPPQPLADQIEVIHGKLKTVETFPRNKESK